MKSKIFLFMLPLFPLLGQSQDATIFTEHWYHGDSVNLNIGQTVTIYSGQSGISIKTHNKHAALEVKCTEEFESCEAFGHYPESSFYVEVNQPFVGGTSQYNSVTGGCPSLEISCVDRYIPQPELFIPLDRENIHSEHMPLDPDENDTMLMLRKANFWENSEDICTGFDGPYGEIVVSVCSTSVMDYTYGELSEDPDLWHDPRIPGSAVNIPGVVYDADLEPGQLYDDPRNEWIDNWWGTYFSNCAIWNWNNSPLTEIALIFSEADPSTEEDVLGRAVINQDWEGCILVKCRMFGWVVIENVIFDSEPTVDVADSYLYLGWDGDKIENYYGPNSDELGTQYNPFQTIDQVESEVSNKIIGVLGDGKIGPGNNLIEPMTYVPAAPTLCSTFSHIIDWYTDSFVNREQNSKYIDPKIFPNPVTNKINVQFNPQKEIKGTIKIYDIVGNLVKSLFIYSDKISIEVSDLGSGVYFLNFETGQNRYIKKIIKL